MKSITRLAIYIDNINEAKDTSNKEAFLDIQKLIYVTTNTRYVIKQIIE